MAISISSNTSNLYDEFWRDYPVVNSAIIDRDSYGGSQRVILDSFEITSADLDSGVYAIGTKIPDTCKILESILVHEQNISGTSWYMDLVLLSGNTSTAIKKHTLISNMRGRNTGTPFYSMYPTFIDASSSDFVALYNRGPDSIPVGSKFSVKIEYTRG